MNNVMKRILVGLFMIVPAVAGADKVWNSGKGTTWDCKKDPVATINHGKGTYRFKGACTRIAVNGGNLKLTAEAVDELVVSGSKNDVSVGSVGAVSVTGSKNKVAWKTAKTGETPTISNLGKDNVIENVGAAKPAAPPAQPPVTATPAKGAIDCSKQPSYVLADNNLDLAYIGKCDTLELAGNKIKVKVESVKTISITGNNNQATIDAADAIVVSGNDNTVSYKKGVSAAKPKLANTGNDNKLSAIK